jgi:hypothetical protein
MKFLIGQLFEMMVVTELKSAFGTNMGYNFSKDLND